MDCQPQAPEYIIPVKRGEEIHPAEPIPCNEKLLANDESLLNFINEQDDETSCENQTDSRQRTKICRVPVVLREKLKDYYDPRAIVIGPIHRKFKKELLMMKLKAKLAARYIKASGQKGEGLLIEINKNIKTLKESFDENVIKDYNDAELARILFLDGCSILQFIYSSVEDELEAFKINHSQAKLVQQDLFLLENQIPFKVLILLLCSSEEKDIFIERICRFMAMDAMALPRYYFRDRCMEIIYPLFFCEDQNSDQSNTRVPVHLLDLLRLTVLDDGGLYQGGEFISAIFCLIDKILSAAISALFDLIPIILSAIIRTMEVCFLTIAWALHSGIRWFRRFFMGSNGSRSRSLFWFLFWHLRPRRRASIYGPSFRTVQELKATGIKLKLSHRPSMNNLSFSTHFFGMKGVLKLPPLVVDKSTILKLWNLVAYEMCFDNYKKEHGITSYLRFLDSLIDTEQDVKDLRSVHILWNHLSTDGEVADLFNAIGSHLVSNDEDYRELKSDIEKHYQRRYASWIAQAARDHFSSPWKILALFAAAIALLFTGIQTWYVIYPKNGAN